MARIFDFQSIRNFRDFGGYKTVDGRTLKVGKLFRSAHFAEVSSDEQAAVTDLDIKLVVDLRHAPERKRQPSQLGAAFHYFELNEPDHMSAPKLAPHEMFLKERLEKPEDARQYMKSSYRARPHDPVFKGIFSKTLLFMAEQGDPFVIHCAAGKDRTGTLAAIIHKTLNVSDLDIMDDYMKTMTAVDIEQYLEPASKFMSQKFDRPISPDALRPMFGVEPAYLEESLNAIGNFDDYLSNALGIDAAMRAKIQKSYLG